MPLPFLVFPLIYGAGMIHEKLLKQREIDHLKKQIITLYAEIERLKHIISEQKRQLNEINMRFSVVKSYLFITKLKYEGMSKGLLYQQYALIEFISLSKNKINNVELNESENTFCNIYSNLIEHHDLPAGAYKSIKSYILEKYSCEIETASFPDFKNLEKEIEEFSNVA